MKKIWIMPVLLLWSGTIVAQTTSVLIKKARMESDVPQKIQLLNQAISQSPDSVQAWHYRGDVYRGQGKLSQAVRDYTQAIRLTPKNPFRYYARALAYMDEKKYTLAAADLTKAISLKKDYLDFYLYRARAQMALEKYAAAVADYQKYLTHNRKTPEIALSLAEAYIKTYKYGQAEKELNFTEQKTDLPEVHFWRGRMLHNQGALDEAVSAYSKAINRDGKFSQAYRYRAAAFKDMGELESSAQDYTSLLELEPEPIFYNRRGLVYEEMEEWDKALADYEKVIELAAKWPIAYTNRGYIYLKQKKYALAKKDFETAISLDNTLPTPYVNLAGLSWLQRKDRKQVFRYLDQAIKRNFRDFESLYDAERKGWMFKGINNTSEFRNVMYK